MIGLKVCPGYALVGSDQGSDWDQAWFSVAHFPGESLLFLIIGSLA